MLQDKSTRFTLFATGILLLGLFLVGWLLSRTAAARRGAEPLPAPAVAPEVSGPVAPPPTVETAPDPALPLDAAGLPRADYQVITDATLVDDPGNEGDSFLLSTSEGTRRFSLYFVDTVETDGGQPEAARDMAAYFGFESEEPLRELGLEARNFSLRLLRANHFRIVTRWEKSPDDGSFLAFVFVQDPDQGLVNLAQWLVRYGLARIVPSDSALPDGMSAEQFRQLLLQEEDRSKADSHGAWNRKSP